MLCAKKIFNMVHVSCTSCDEINMISLRPGTPVLEVIFNKYLIFEFSTGTSFLLLGL